MENWLNDSLDWDHIKKTLTDEKHILVTDIFRQDMAEKIYDCLETQVPWQVAYRQGNKDVIVNRHDMENWTEDQNKAFHSNLITQAKNAYQFCYDRYPMIDALIQGWDQGLYLHKVTEFLNGEHFIRFAHHITGDLAIRKCEPQATCYRSGSFLKLHNDHASREQDRRYALVFNMTKDWVSDWGGLLQLVDDKGIKETVMPIFNSVSILKLPQLHQVSYVAPYATKPRFAITSWLRAD